MPCIAKLQALPTEHGLLSLGQRLSLRLSGGSQKTCQKWENSTWPIHKNSEHFLRIVNYSWPDGQSAAAVDAEHRDAMKLAGVHARAHVPRSLAVSGSSNDVHHHPAHPLKTSRSTQLMRIKCSRNQLDHIPPDKYDKSDSPWLACQVYKRRYSVCTASV